MKEKGEDVQLLLVDDEQDFLQSAVAALTRRGIKVTTAPDGEEALAKVRSQTFDVVVTDVKMPGMDGVELFRRLQREQPDLPAIILTGHGSINQAFETSRDGIFDYLTKPCDMNELAAKICEAAREHTSNLIEKEGEKPLSEDELIRVLLVDDEKDFLDAMKSVLKRRNMIVFVSRSAEDAIEFLHKSSVDVVVLDIKMSGMDGIDALRHMKQDYPLIEVLLLTGHPNIETAILGTKHGAREYLVKPPHMEDLTKAIRRAYLYRKNALEEKRKNDISDIYTMFPD